MRLSLRRTAQTKARSRREPALPPGFYVLLSRWRQWTRIVAVFHKHSNRRRRLDEASYGELHEELIACCQALSDAAEGDGATYFRNLEEVLRPWPTLRSLALADRTSVGLLHQKCREVEQQLSARPATRLLLIAASAAALVLVSYVLNASFPLDEFAVWGADAVDHWTRVINYQLSHQTYSAQLAIFAFVVVGLAVWQVRRTLKY